MACRHLLHLDSGGMRAYRWRDGTLSMEDAFTAADGAAFEAYLRRHARSAFQLLADLPEEGFRIDNIPPVRGRDRQALIDRRLGQHFHGTPLAACISLGRTEAGRRDEHILCAAFTRPEDFEPWLTLLAAAETRLSGIHSAALLSEALPDIRPPAPALLLSFSRGGLRQSFFLRGRLRFSRLTPWSIVATEERARACAREAARIHEYLLGQELIQWHTPLPVLILAHPDQTAVFHQHCQDSAQLQFRLVNLLERAREAGLRTPPADSNDEPLLLHWQARGKKLPQFAPNTVRRFFLLHQWRQGLRAAGATAFAAALIFSGARALEIYDLREQAARLQVQAQAARQTHEAMLKTLPPLPMDADRLRSLLARHDTLMGHSPSPRDLHARLGRVLERLPQVELQRIDWFLADSLEPTDEHPQSVAARQGDAFAIARVEARLAGAPQARQQTLDALQTQLAADGILDVQILPTPQHPASEGVIKSAATVGEESLPLILRIARRLP